MVSYKLMHRCLNQTLAAALQGKGEKRQVIHSPLLAYLPNPSECNFLLQKAELLQARRTSDGAQQHIFCVISWIVSTEHISIT